MMTKVALRTAYARIQGKGRYGRELSMQRCSISAGIYRYGGDCMGMGCRHPPCVSGAVQPRQSLLVVQQECLVACVKLGAASLVA
eukprot:7803219-Pyramimonas_sp.AAC.1